MKNIEIINTLINLISSFGTIVALFALSYQIITERMRQKREQDNKVSTWLDDSYKLNDEKQSIVIYYSSDYPIYEVVVSIDDVYDEGTIGSGEDQCLCIDILPLGQYVVEMEFDGFGMNHVFSSSITFRDHFNRYWTRDARGTLVKEKDNVIEKKRNIYRPYMSTFFRKINK